MNLELIFVFVLILEAIILLPFLIQAMAKNNFIFTIVKEGTAKAITKNGQFHRAILCFHQHFFDEDWNVWDEKQLKWLLSEEESPKKDEVKKAIEQALKIKLSAENPVPRKRRFLSEYLEMFFDFWIIRAFFSNIRIVGIPMIYKVHTYRFYWVSLEQKNIGGEVKEIPVWKEEELDFVLLRDDNYFLRIEAAETSDLVPVNADITFGIRVVNPRKALFEVEMWLENCLRRLEPKFRTLINDYNYEFIHRVGKKEPKQNGNGDAKLKKSEGNSKESSGQHKPEEVLQNLLEKSGIAEELEFRYGVHFIKDSVQISKVDPINNKFVEKAAAEWEGERDKKGRIQRAMGEAEEIRMIYAARADGFEGLAKKAKDYGVSAQALVGFASLEKIGEKGNLVVTSADQGLILQIPREKKGE
jgi:hypothetical protein